MARVYVAEKKKYVLMDVEGEIILALTGLTLSNHNFIVKHVIQYRRQNEVSCLRLPFSVRRYKHGNQSKSLDMLQLLSLDYTAVLRR